MAPRLGLPVESGLDVPGERLDAAEGLRESGIHLRGVDSQVVADEDVPAPRHGGDLFSAARGENARRAEDARDIRLIVRSLQVFPGSDVIPDVKGARKRYVQVPLAGGLGPMIVEIGGRPRGRKPRRSATHSSSRRSRAAIVSRSMTRASLANPSSGRLRLDPPEPLPIQVALGHRHPESDPGGIVPAEWLCPVDDQLLGQERRLLIQDHHLHLVRVEDAAQIAEEADLAVQVPVAGDNLRHEHGEVDIADRRDVPRGVRPEELGYRHFRPAGETFTASRIAWSVTSGGFSRISDGALLSTSAEPPPRPLHGHRSIADREPAGDECSSYSAMTVTASLKAPMTWPPGERPITRIW